MPEGKNSKEKSGNKYKLIIQRSERSLLYRFYSCKMDNLYL